MHSKLRFLLASAITKTSCIVYSSSPSIKLFHSIPENRGWLPQLKNLTHYSLLIGRSFCGYAAEQFSDPDYECSSRLVFSAPEYNPLLSSSSSVANIDEWKCELSMLLRSDMEQEIVSRDERDWRDFKQISGLAKMMGLYCEIYGKVVVASNAPLPNYRPDLDDERPQREVVIPLSLQRSVAVLLQEHVDRTILSAEKIGQKLHNADTATDTHTYPFLDGFAMEKVLPRRNLDMRDMQRSWQESPEGQRMLDFRMSLPAFKEKARLLQAIKRNQVVVISGETGCGKTTQLPQYILESEIDSGWGEFCSIICTQPRRISPRTVAERVAAERGEPLGNSVGYKVRLERMKRKNTRLLYCTSGILLRRLLNDRNLDGISHVFVDEIHERGMNEDFLLIVLKDLLPRRRDLKLILMSATLNAELFSSYFGAAPMIHIPEALNKSTFDSYSSKVRESLSSWTPDNIGFNLIKAVLCHICLTERPGAVLVFLAGWEDISSLRNQLKAHPLLGDPNRVLVLSCHGSMAISEQKLIFEKPPPNVRKIVLATNVAESSITINDIVFVVDCGKAKETSYDALNNTPCLLPSWISQSSARQRRGRAGRVQADECYHLYPRCVYEAFAEYRLPELLRTPLNSLCLQIKSLCVKSIADFLSAALQPPESLAVQNAIEFLKMIGALDENENLTRLGEFLSVLPVDPKLGKMLIMGAILCCFNPILTSVAALSVRDPFLFPQEKKDLGVIAKSRFSAQDYSDHIALVRAYEGWKDANREGSVDEYCSRNCLSVQTLQAIHSLRKQFFYILKNAGLIGTNGAAHNRLSHNQSLVRAAICSGLFPGIASVVHWEGSMSFETMEDGQVLPDANSVIAHDHTIKYPWLVFGEKVKVDTVFVRDLTGISDSILIIFGGKVSYGDTAGHLKMLEGYIDFFMDPNLADCYIKLKEELNKLVQKKLQNPNIDIYKEGKYLMLAVQELISGDQCEGRFVFSCENKKPGESSSDKDSFTRERNTAPSEEDGHALSRILYKVFNQRERD